LEFTSELTPQPDWKPVEPAPSGNVFTTSMTQTPRFFRLRNMEQ
jgi:hypothetical protein